MGMHNKDPRPKSKIEGDSLTQQQFGDETNINTIAERAKRTRVFGSPDPNGRRPIFADVSAVDFQEMQNRMADINSQFASLPPKVRLKFGNSPYQLVRFVNDPANYKEAVKLKLRVPDFEDPFEDENQEALPLKADPEANPRPSEKPKAESPTPPKGATTP